MNFFLKPVFHLILFCCVLSASVAVADESGLNLTEEEKAWLSAHPIIRIGIDAGYAPYSFLDKNGSFIGVAPDLISLISKKLGVKFEAIPGLTWPQIVQGSREHTLDIIATAVSTEERKTFLDFTQIYISTPLVIMTRSDDDRINSASDIDEMSVALVKGYSSSKRVIEEHSSAKIIQVNNPKEGLHAVSSGEADAYVGVLGINIYQAQKEGITNLKVAGNYDVVSNGQRIAVRNDWPILRDILDKSLDSITEEERKVIYDKWINVSYMEHVDYGLLWKIVLGFLVVMSLMYFHNRRLSIEIARRETVEKKLLEMNESLIKARDEADKANQTKSEFLSVMSHELRTPLTSIKGALGLLSGGVAVPLPEEAVHMLSIASENSDRLAMLVDDILDFEKFQSGGMIFQKTTIKVDRVDKQSTDTEQRVCRSVWGALSL